MNRKPVVRYSEAFKLQVIRDLEKGRYGSPWEAARAHGVGAGTVAYWVRRHGRHELLRKVVHVMKADELVEVKALRQRVRDLERALADKECDLQLGEAYLEIACEAAGVKDVEAFKKKHAGKG